MGCTAPPQRTSLCAWACKRWHLLGAWLHVRLGPLKSTHDAPHAPNTSHRPRPRPGRKSCREASLRHNARRRRNRSAASAAAEEDSEQGSGGHPAQAGRSGAQQSSGERSSMHSGGPSHRTGSPADAGQATGGSSSHELRRSSRVRSRAQAQEADAAAEAGARAGEAGGGRARPHAWALIRRACRCCCGCTRLHSLHPETAAAAAAAGDGAASSSLAASLRGGQPSAGQDPQDTAGVSLEGAAAVLGSLSQQLGSLSVGPGGGPPADVQLLASLNLPPLAALLAEQGQQPSLNNPFLSLSSLGPLASLEVRCTCGPRCAALHNAGSMPGRHSWCSRWGVMPPGCGGAAGPLSCWGPLWAEWLSRTPLCPL